MQMQVGSEKRELVPGVPAEIFGKTEGRCVTGCASPNTQALPVDNEWYICPNPRNHRQEPGNEESEAGPPRWWW